MKRSISLVAKTALSLRDGTVINLNKTSFQKQSGIDRMRNLLSISTSLGKTLTGEAGYLNQYGFVRGGRDTVDHIAYFALSLSH